MKKKKIRKRLDKVQTLNSEIEILSALIDYVLAFYKDCEDTIKDKTNIDDAIFAIEAEMQGWAEDWGTAVDNTKFWDKGVSGGFYAVFSAVWVTWGCKGSGSQMLKDAMLVINIGMIAKDTKPETLSFFRFFVSIPLKIMFELELSQLFGLTCDDAYDKILRLGHIDPSLGKEGENYSLWDFCEKYCKPMD